MNLVIEPGSLLCIETILNAENNINYLEKCAILLI